MLPALGAAAAVLACAAWLLTLGPDPVAPRPPARPVATDRLAQAQQTARARPQDPGAWAELATAELDRARLTLDAGRLAAADQALRRSLALKPERNYDAVAGQGMLANARHEFDQGREYGRQATAMAPDRPAGYAVLADAEIQLGHDQAATAAEQRLLDLQPTVAGFTRAAYDLELHGRTEEAGIALDRALESAGTPADRAFCAHRQGDLAWANGRIPEAAERYRLALAAAPEDPAALAGQARVAAAQGRTAEASRGYRQLADRAPVPQFLLEAAEFELAQGSAETARRYLAGLDAEARLLQASGGPVDPHLGLYLADHGDPRAAVELLRGEWGRRHHAEVADALGWALHRAGDDPAALDYLRTAAESGWRSAQFAYHRGAVELALGRPEARADLASALALNPKFSPYHAPEAARLLAGE